MRALIEIISERPVRLTVSYGTDENKSDFKVKIIKLTSGHTIDLEFFKVAKVFE